MVSYYDHKTGQVPRPTILMDKRTSDAHDNPTIMIDGAGHIWVFSSSHGTARPSYISRSTEPYSIGEFERVAKTNFSYPQAWWVEGKGFLFLHTKYRGGHRTLRWMTSKDGLTWSRPRTLAYILGGDYQMSWPHEGKVGTCFNHHLMKGPNWRRKLYYLETEDFGKTWKTVDGKVVRPPLKDVINPALVHDFEAEGPNVYLKDMNYDSKGRPVLLVVTSKGYEAGPKNAPRTWTTARWTGTRWEIRKAFTSDSNYDMGSLYIEPDGTWRIIAPTEQGPQAYNPGGEMVVWTSADKGNTWKRLLQITSNSRRNHTYARRPLNAHEDFYAFWADGDARKPSESRLHFSDKSGKNVRRLPAVMNADFAKPEVVEETSD
jgi:hypothetical protein